MFHLEVSGEWEPCRMLDCPVEILSPSAGLKDCSTAIGEFGGSMRGKGVSQGVGTSWGVGEARRRDLWEYSCFCS